MPDRLGMLRNAVLLESVPQDELEQLAALVRPVVLKAAETFAVRGLDKLAPKAKLRVEATSARGDKTTFNVLARVDDPTDLEYVRQGGILQQVLRERIAAN